MSHHWQSYYIMLMLLLSVSLAGCNLGTAAPETTVVPTPDIPTIEFLEPPNNSQVFEGFNLLLDIVAHDEAEGIAKIEFYVDGELINDVTPQDVSSVPVFRAEMNWLAQREGLHVLTAIAYREDGTSSDEALLNIQVVLRE